MRAGHKRRDAFSLAISVGVHVALVSALAIIPARSKKSFDAVDMSVFERAPKPPPPKEEPIPEVPEAPEPIEETKTQRKTRAPKPTPVDPTVPPDDKPPPIAPPETEDVPEDAESAPPVFDLGDNTFAAGGGGGWSLNRSEGNTKFAGVAKRSQPPVRGTRAVGDKDGESGGTGTGYGPVPIKDLSKRPKPRYGNISAPSYPPEARREGIEGAVVLQVFIGKNGRVKRVRVVKDPGGGLGQVAKTAMLKERWTPPLDKNGDAVDTVIIYSYRFVLDG